MNSAKQPAAGGNPNLTIEEVCAHFENWRTRRRRKTAIPERLWAEAIALCRHYPISTVARSLRLNHSDLKNRVERAAGMFADPADPDFVELSLQPEPCVEYTLEIGRKNGNYIRAHLQGKPSELMTRIITLWSAVA